MIAFASPDLGFLAFGLPGHGEWLILLVLGLLIFGRRLPEVGRSIGRSIVEFKKGIKGIEDDIETESSGNAKLDQKPTERIGKAPGSPVSEAKKESPTEEEMAATESKAQEG